MASKRDAKSASFVVFHMLHLMEKKEISERLQGRNDST